MIRNLKVLLAAAMAVAAMGAVTASAAQAHTPATWHCAVEPCVVTMTPDGTVGSKTAHFVFIVAIPPNLTLSMTCNQFTYEGTLSKKTVTSYLLKNIKYHGCNFQGTPASVNTNECSYNVTEEETSIECPTGKEIEMKMEGGECTVTVGPQGPIKGVRYHNIKPGAFKEVTVETALAGIQTKTTGAGCPGTGSSNESAITTGNGIVTAEEDKVISNMVDFWWTPTVP